MSRQHRNEERYYLSWFIRVGDTESKREDYREIIHNRHWPTRKDSPCSTFSASNNSTVQHIVNSLIRFHNNIKGIAVIFILLSPKSAVRNLVKSHFFSSSIFPTIIAKRNCTKLRRGKFTFTLIYKEERVYISREESTPMPQIQPHWSRSCQYP